MGVVGIIGAVVGLASAGYSAASGAAAKEDEASYYNAVADIREVNAIQSKADAVVAAHNDAHRGAREYAVIRSALYKGGVDAATGSALEVSTEAMRDLALRKQLILYEGDKSFWANKSGQQDMKSKARTTTAGISSQVIGQIIGGIGRAVGAVAADPATAGVVGGWLGNSPGGVFPNAISPTPYT